MNKCMLPKEFNSCPDLADDNICTRSVPHQCNMLERISKPKTQNNYVRKERWYEKYYKGGK